MSAFYVGQPVRVNCKMSEIHGRETWVIALDEPGVDDGIDFIGIEVFDVSEDRKNYPYFGGYVFEPHELEPILPPGLESTAEIAALYEPEDAIA